MYNLAPTDLIALANLDLAFQERALRVDVVVGVVHVHAVRRDGQESVYMHNGDNVWTRQRAGDSNEIHFIDRDAPDEPAYKNVCDECGTHFAGGYVGARCPLASRTSDDERCTGTMIAAPTITDVNASHARTCEVMCRSGHDKIEGFIRGTILNDNNGEYDIILTDDEEDMAPILAACDVSIDDLLVDGVYILTNVSADDVSIDA